MTSVLPGVTQFVNWAQIMCLASNLFMIPLHQCPESNTTKEHLSNSLFGSKLYERCLSSQKHWKRLGRVNSHSTDEERMHREARQPKYLVQELAHQ